MPSFILYLLAIWKFQWVAAIVMLAIGILWMIDWLTWQLGEDDIDINHQRRMK